MTLRELLKIKAQEDPNKPPQKENKSFCGFDVTIEYPKGSIRELKNDQGEVVYKKFMKYPYGYFSGTEGRDGDEVDCILGPDNNCTEAFVAHMLDKGPDVDEREDEDKVLIGFSNYALALAAFHSMYPLSFFGGMTVLPLDVFRETLNQAQLPYREKKLHANRGSK